MRSPCMLKCDMLFHRLKAFLADDMLDLTGILGGCFFGYAETHQIRSQKLVPLVDHLRDGTTLVREMDEPGIRHGNMFFLPEIIRTFCRRS